MTDQVTSTHIQVSFRKQVSDGNYGTEAAEVIVTRDCAPLAQAELTEIMLREARGLVHAELGRSPSSNVRRALEPPMQRVAPAVTVPDDEESLEDLPY